MLLRAATPVVAVPSRIATALRLVRTRLAMSAPVAAPSAINLLDAVIAQIDQLPASIAAAAPAGKSLLPTETKDIRWWPIVPVGHTAYTFFGVDADHPNGVIPASAASPSSTKPAAAPSTAAAPAPKPAGEKKEKAAKPAAAPKAPKSAAKAPEPDQPEYTKLDIRVGQIVKAGRHPKPEVTSLYVEEIDVGEDQPRQIVSGLVKYVPLDVFEKSRVCVICNLKPSPLQGVVSNGMVLAASTGEGDARVVELIQPPAGAKPGDRLIPLDGDFSAFAPLEVVDPRKKNKAGEPDNAWARVAATLKTNDAKEATWNGIRLGTAAGVAVAPSLANANIA